MIPIKFLDGPLAGKNHFVDDSIGPSVVVTNSLGERGVEVYEYKMINGTHDGERLCKFVRQSSSPAGELVPGSIVLHSDRP